VDLLALLAGIIAVPIAAVTAGGFSIPAVFGDVLARAYLLGVKPAPVLTGPTNWPRYTSLSGPIPAGSPY